MRCGEVDLALNQQLQLRPVDVSLEGGCPTSKLVVICEDVIAGTAKGTSDGPRFFVTAPLEPFFWGLFSPGSKTSSGRLKLGKKKKRLA
jgi:hypothetical protein